MAKVRAPIDPVADLRRRLARIGRGALPLGKIQTCVRTWWRDHELDDHPATVGKRIAIVLIEQRSAVHKLAGILVLEKLGDQLRAADVTAFARLFHGDHLAAFDVVDRFATCVLGAMLEHESAQADVAHALASWRSAETGWQRRAACVAFTRIAANGNSSVPGLASVILAMCSTVVWSIECCDQTAVGWVLRELARVESDRVEAFVVRHARLMSRECARLAITTLPTDRRTELLAHHTRATTLRR